MQTENTYRQCTRCIMDTTAKGISFDSQGHCSFCREYEQRHLDQMIVDNAILDKRMADFVARVKRDGAGKKYDCIVGLSGGADSSYALYLAKQHGLRPLAVHMDNGWNSELAVHNIQSLISKLGVDLYTHVIDWDEYKQLMQSFFDADVIDVELLYDNAMTAVNYQLARKYGIKWILAGTNVATEGMRIPSNWLWLKKDKKNIQAIARLNNVKIRTFPLFGTVDFIYNEFIRKVKWVSFLDLIDYNKENCISFLKSEFSYKPYPYKHYESVFTRFYQGYILPEKFTVDKRKVHFSTLIMSGQLSRDEAKALMQSLPYPSEKTLNEDIDFFLKKMRWSKEQLANYIARPEKPHLQYGSEKPLWDFCEDVYRKLAGKPRTDLSSIR
ncbi:N-acetyl sugar amidotransferase [Neisseriaceae bacterium JH1-16]|nr:N-acetyl sugar amidotransferase [Neisseriaceae bacterium JH1-16]